MLLQRDKGIGSPAQFNTGLPPVQTTEEVPRWLAVLGLTAALTLLVALLRYAIDLLGVVFLIIFVGFSIRTISDWLTEGESVSAVGARRRHVGSRWYGLRGHVAVRLEPRARAASRAACRDRCVASVELAGVARLGTARAADRTLRAFGSGAQLARGGLSGGAATARRRPHRRARASSLPSLGSQRARKRAGAKDDDRRRRSVGARTSIVRGRTSSDRERAGWRSGSEAENDVRPAANVQTFTTVITLASVDGGWHVGEADRLRHDRDRQRGAVGRRRLPTRWRRARHSAAAQRARRQHRVARRPRACRLAITTSSPTIPACRASPPASRQPFARLVARR